MEKWDWPVFAAGLVWCAYLLMIAPVTAAVCVSESGFGTGIGFIRFSGAVLRAQRNAAGIRKQRKKKRKFPKEMARRMIRHIKIEKIIFSGVIGFENCMDTALLTGALNALACSMPQTVVSVVRADFAGQTTSAEILGILSVRCGHIICAALKTATIHARERIKTWKSTRLTD